MSGALARPLADSDMKVPLAVDFDGTICLVDTLLWLRARCRSSPQLETLRQSARASSKQAEKLFLWEHVGLDIDSLPWDEEILHTLAAQSRQGRQLILVTGSAQPLARAAVERLGIFDEYWGSTSDVNLTGMWKAAKLVEVFGEGGYDYVGDSPADVPVWSKARLGYFLDRPGSVPFEIPIEVRRLPSTRPLQTPWIDADGDGDDFVVGQ